VIVGVGAVGFVARIMTAIPILTSLFEGQGNVDGLSPMMSGSTSAVGLIGALLVYLMMALGWAWTATDIMDRRANWLWVLPMFICCCCEAHWLAMAIYMLAGRKPA
jgi:hypothetical protein